MLLATLGKNNRRIKEIRRFFFCALPSSVEAATGIVARRDIAPS
jgi:hypothetical protein